MSEFRRLILPSVEVILFILIFWESLLFMPKMLNGDGDLGRHLVIGNYILTTGRIPTQDIFSHVLNGSPLVPHEWLSELVFALAWRAAGLNGVAWLTALVLATTFALLTMGLRQMGVRALVAFAMAFAASLVGALHFLPRPHLFTILCFTLCLLLLENYRRTSRWHFLLPLPLLFISWANLHGAFISGLILMALFMLGAAMEKNWRQAAGLSGLLMISLLVCMLNPAGPLLLSNSFGYLQERFLVDTTVEYQSPNFHIISTWPFAALILCSLVVGWRGRSQPAWPHLLALGTWTAFALYSARNIPLYAAVAVVALARPVDGWISELAPRFGRYLSRTDLVAGKASGWIWAVVAVAVFVNVELSGTRLDFWQRGNTFDPTVFPVAAVDSLPGLPANGRVFNEFTWGGYLLYRLWPTQQVFIDGQTDFYGDALTREYLQIVNAQPGWEETLSRYNIQWVIVPPARPLVSWLAHSPGWVRCYQDETAVIWVRQ